MTRSPEQPEQSRPLLTYYLVSVTAFLFVVATTAMAVITKNSSVFAVPVGILIAWIVFAMRYVRKYGRRR